jgi:serine/threonine protein kinase
VHRCPTCGKQLEDGIRFCPEDGTPLSDTAAAHVAPTPTSATPTRALKSQVLQLPVVLDNRYRLEELRGGGGMAKVYKATDQRFERTVAVKIINPELRHDPEFDARFQREARIVSQLSDPHIVVVHDFGIDAQHGPYLVMEYLQGQTLRERIATQGTLPARAAIQLGGQILLALIHAHEKNVVHRDIKPDNIFLLNQSGVRLHVRVLDFGIARIFRGDDKSDASQLTHPGAVLGTPRYMSPEQLAGHTVDARSDLYSTAMVLHEAMTGQLPFLSGKKLCELCPEAPPTLQEILESCLKPNPAERPQSAVDLYLRLQEMGKASGILLLPPGTLEKMLQERASRHDASTIKYATGGPKRKWWYVALAAIAGLAVLAGLVWLLFLRS